MTITLDIKPGVYDFTAAEYHRDPVPGGSLSSSGARNILPPSCPARFHYDATHPRAPKKAFDLGHAAHKIVLGVGPELVQISAEEWRTNAVKAEVAEVRERGAVPLRPSEYKTVHAMAAELAAHPYAGRLFHPLGGGKPEQTLIWYDAEFEVWRRSMLDWLPAPPGRRLLVPDYKTADNVSTPALSRAMATYGYHQQADWYLDGIAALGLAEDAAFIFVAQEKVPPYLVNVFEPDPPAMQIARDRNRRALEIYRDCTASGHWPGYATDVETIALPRWAERQHEESYD